MNSLSFGSFLIASLKYFSNKQFYYNIYIKQKIKSRDDYGIRTHAGKPKGLVIRRHNHSAKSPT